MLAELLTEGRAAAEALMVDTCVIRRADGTGTTDPDTGYPTESVAQLYAGPCRVQQHQATATREDVGQDNLLLLRLEVQLPMSVTGLEVGDRIEIVTSVHDPDLPGRVFLVHDLAHKTHATSRRVQCIERTGS